MKNYHLIVIGAGSGGLVCAAGAAIMGAKVGLIEKHKMGGDCLNTGCVPSKAIIRSAKLAYDAKRARDFGLEMEVAQPKLDKVMASMREVQAKIAPNDSVERFTGLGAHVYLGSFHFTSPFEITDGKQTLSAKRFVIATGSSPALPPIPGIEKVPILTSENLWELNELPQRLVVLGGGPIGAEMAQTFARLGSQVMLVDNQDRILSREDPEVSDLLEKVFRREGIKTYLGYQGSEIKSTQGGHELQIRHPEKGKELLTFDRMLVAVGRRPNVAGLGLEAAGVKHSPRGIPIDPYLRTNQKHIYACGDVSGPFQFTHTADYQARIILRNALFPGKSKARYKVVPWSTFTDPEVARVGINESEAKKKNIPYDAYQFPLADLDRAICDREEEGFIKLLTKKDSDQILGVTLMASHGGDLLAEFILAMQKKLGLKTLANMIHVYPTMSEVAKRIAGVYQSSRLTPRTKTWLKKFFRWRFG